MSGIEIVGLVLGVIPILIRALEGYSETRKSSSKVDILDGIIRKLREYNFILQCDVIKVLKAAGVDDIPIDTIASGSSISLFKDHDIQRQVIEYLGSGGFSLYKERLECCQAAIINLANVFEGLVSTEKYSGPRNTSQFLEALVKANSTVDSIPKLSKTLKKIKFSLKMRELNPKMLELERSFEMLQLLTDARSDLNTGAETIVSPAIPKLLELFNRVQKYATELHIAIDKCLSSSCRYEHSIRLFLDERAEILRSRKPHKVTFQVDVVSMSSKEIIDIQRNQVRFIEKDEENLVMRDESKKSVRFEINSTTTQPKSMHSACLCLNIAETASTRDSMVFHLPGRESLSWAWKSCHNDPAVPSPKVSTKNNDFAHITLLDILERCQNPHLPERRWSLSERMKLAFKLACSILQLNRTQWLTFSCQSQQIFFERAPDCDQFPTSFNADSPFLYNTTLLNTPQITNRSVELAHYLIVDLGILLMELWKRTTFVEWVKKDSIGAGKARSVLTLAAATTEGSPYLESYDRRYNAAIEWLREIHHEMPPEYATAVCACIENGSLQIYTWNDVKFRQRFAEGVVEPLWKIYKVFNK